MCTFCSMATEAVTKPGRSLYIDQPIGVGFSYGPEDILAAITEDEAATDVWNVSFRPQIVDGQDSDTVLIV